MPIENLSSSFSISALDEHHNSLTQSHDFVVAMSSPEPPVFKPVSIDGYVNYADSFSDIKVEGSASIGHVVKVDYRTRSYLAEVDDRGDWSLALPFPGDDIYPLTATSYFDPSHESQPASSEFVVDTNPPRVVGAELLLLDSAVVKLEFDEVLTAGSITHSNLKILMDHRPIAVHSARVSSDGYFLEISLGDLPSPTNELSATYIPSSSDAFVVQDIAGNSSELILNHTVNHLVADDDVDALAGDYKSVLLHGSDSINAVGIFKQYRYW